MGELAKQIGRYTDYVHYRAVAEVRSLLSLSFSVHLHFGRSNFRLLSH
jgi:hypothetical protein